MISPRTLQAILGGYLPGRASFTASEADALRALPSKARQIRRGESIVVQGRRHDSIYLLDFGFASRYRVFSNGKRQVLHVALPGDMLGFPTCFFEHALYSVGALTDACVHEVTFADLAEILDACPRLAMAMMSWAATETAIHVEHLATVGRRSSDQKVAHFNLEMGMRLRAIGIGDGTVFDMPLTQEQIADVLGLSASHVNRTLRRLREDGLLDQEGTRIRLRDRHALATLADFDGAYLATSGEPGSAAGQADPLAESRAA